MSVTALLANRLRRGVGRPTETAAMQLGGRWHRVEAVELPFVLTRCDQLWRVCEPTIGDNPVDVVLAGEQNLIRFQPNAVCPDCDRVEAFAVSEATPAREQAETQGPGQAAGQEPVRVSTTDS